jgi:two-component system LytT family sensor kinase
MKQLRIPVIATHITGWLLFQSLPLVFLLDNGETGFTDRISKPGYWLFCLYYIAIFYLHSYVLLPRFFHARKWWLYVISMGLMVASLFWLSPFEKLMSGTRRMNMSENRMQPPPGQQFTQQMFRQPDKQTGQGPGPSFGRGRRGHQPRIDMISIILFIMIITLSVAMDLTRRWRAIKERAARAETDKANAELSFLKAQINPHFLFNTLNNIYSMAVTRNEHTPAMIMKLSNIMRYVTDDVNEDFVSLQSEVDCITDYIDLQKLRLGKKVTLDYSVSGDLDHKKISPLVLMTFIENVFKYGTSSHEESHLIIKLVAGEGRIDFLTQNPLYAVDRKIERTGIGISNTQQRLEHLYPGKHKLGITREDGMFIVRLALYEGNQMADSAFFETHRYIV